MSMAGQVVITKDDIVKGLRALEVRGGMGLMVHSSLSRYGRVEGGAITVIEALQEVLTGEGTLLMPSFNHGFAYKEDGPGYFAPHETKTINGKIPDTFWRMDDVYRSIHPTHSFAAWGKNALRYTEGHHRTLTLGPDSPLGRLLADDGWCLFAGVRYGSNTFHHLVEVYEKSPCLRMRTEAMKVRLEDGREIDVRSWSYRERGCPLNDGGKYGDEMAAGGFDRQRIIGESMHTLYRLRDGYEVIARGLRDGRDDTPGCSECPIRPQKTEFTVASDWDDVNGCIKE